MDWLGRAALVAALVAAGCNGSSSKNGDSAPPKTDGKTDSSGVLDTGGADGPGMDCPGYLPNNGEVCLVAGAACSYGDPQCPAKARCAQGVWQVAIAKCPGSGPSCPDTYADASGQGCQTKDEACDYTGLSCTCTNCTKYPVEQCSGPLTWRCEAPNTDPDCPHARPQEGASCAKDGQFCNYGCEPDVSRKCEGGKWAKASAPGGCPVSTRRAKEGIRYITRGDRARIAAQARRLRLATYRLRRPAPDRRSHLGFILEDSPDVAAADMGKLQVDLYSYTSMVLALAQEQQREIGKLRRELQALRAEMARIRRSE
jgi:hypothetical protein